MVRGMSAVRHVLPPELLVRLAAGVVAEQGAALRVAPDVDLRDLFFGFSGQVGNQITCGTCIATVGQGAGGRGGGA